jgi:hypothetical protein
LRHARTPLARTLQPAGFPNAPGAPPATRPRFPPADRADGQRPLAEAFRGAGNCLQWIVGLQSEISVEPIYARMPHYLESLREYEKQGYVLHHLVVVNRTDTQDLLELNCYMRRR